MKKIALSGVRGKGKYAIVDDEDYDFLSQFSWSLSRKGYAQTYIPVRLQSKFPCSGVQMQRMLLWNSLSKGQIVDHINRNKLDNRRENLRICDVSESNMNRGKIRFSHKQEKVSSYKGVWWDRNKWRCAITFNNHKIYLGRFDSEHDAAIAYNVAAKLLHKDYACCNEVPSDR